MMEFLPLDRMSKRVEIDRGESDPLLFNSLLLYGEMLLKTVACALVACIEDEKDRHQYRLMYDLVRASSLGEWDRIIGDALTGPASQYLKPAARAIQKELTQKCLPGTWQYDTVSTLNHCLKDLGIVTDNLPAKVQSMTWFSTFVTLRNKTRGHGAQLPGAICEVCPLLEDSIRQITDNMTLFQLQWAHLYRNISGKYRITKIATDSDRFEPLKGESGASLDNGVYLWLDDPIPVKLMVTDADVSDFFYPNGDFNGKTFSELSYITGNSRSVSAAPYMIPLGELPPSETQALGELVPQGEVFGNLPPAPDHYIHREDIESELLDKLVDKERHPIVTLSGRGGIGKTWLALTAAHQMAGTQHYAAIIWFSSRDIDLLPSGPKVVRPHVLSTKQISKEFTRLVAPQKCDSSDRDPLRYFADHLTKTPFGEPVLFIFDNFETVRSPADLYSWLDEYIRPPNKILITTRARDFKGDYPIEVLGMSKEESRQLIETYSKSLGVQDKMNRKKSDRIFQDSFGHPYVIKIIIGEIAKGSRSSKVDIIMAGKEDILHALFERTYETLSEAARRVFLTASRRRSPLSRLALESVLLRHEAGLCDVSDAIDELKLSSLIVCLQGEHEDGSDIITVPTTAAVFGRRKLEVSEWKSAVEADSLLLQEFGALDSTRLRSGIEPSIRLLFRNVANHIAKDEAELDKYRPMLDLICRRLPRAWFFAADLYDELQMRTEVKDALRGFLETRPAEPDRSYAWDRLSAECFKSSDWPGAMHALIEKCKSSDVSWVDISSSANQLSLLLRDHYTEFESEDRLHLISDMVALMENRISEASGNDFSKLAWLYMSLKDVDTAKHYAKTGLDKDPGNVHCLRLLSRLAK